MTPIDDIVHSYYYYFYYFYYDYHHRPPPPTTARNLYEDLDDIARMYLQDTFAIDIVGSLPVQYLDCIPKMEVGKAKLMRLLRMVKLLRSD